MSLSNMGYCPSCLRLHRHTMKQRSASPASSDRRRVPVPRRNHAVPGWSSARSAGYADGPPPRRDRGAGRGRQGRSGAGRDGEPVSSLSFVREPKDGGAVAGAGAGWLGFTSRAGRAPRTARGLPSRGCSRRETRCSSRTRGRRAPPRPPRIRYPGLQGLYVRSHGSPSRSGFRVISSVMGALLVAARRAPGPGSRARRRTFYSRAHVRTPPAGRGGARPPPGLRRPEGERTEGGRRGAGSSAAGRGDQETAAPDEFVRALARAGGVGELGGVQAGQVG